MPVTPTYPGVYIQEVPSGVRTITGVATSIGAFFGRATKGPLNTAVHVLSLSDFVRAFGSPHPQSELAASVAQFFANGGSDCYVVRLANAAAAASAIVLRNWATTPVLKATAKSAGLWGNGLRLEVDYNTPNPGESFNLRVIQEEGGREVGRETHDNLYMDPASARFAPAYVTLASQLIKLELDTGLNLAVGSFDGFSEGRRPLGTTIAQASAALNTLINTDHRHSFEISVDGSPYAPVSLSALTALPTAQPALNTALAGPINAALGALVPARQVAVDVAVGAPGTQFFLRLTAATPGGDNAQVRVRRAATNDIAAALLLGAENGGVELARRSNFRPAPTGSVLRYEDGAGGLARLNALAGLAANGLTTLTIGTEPPVGLAALNTTGTATDPWFMDAKPGDSPSGHRDGVREKLLILAQAISNTAGTRFRAEVQGYQLVVLPKDGPPNDMPSAIAFAGTGGATVNPAWERNTRQYAVGGPSSSVFVGAVTPGQDGGAPTFADYVGDPVLKTGFNALDKVDIFNLMILPADSDVADGVRRQLWGPASIYCQQHRAFLLVDAPDTWTNAQGLPAIIQDTSDVNALRATVIKDHSAVFYPKIRLNDRGLIRTISPSGSIAGLMARIDGSRGVWKAPAGGEADLRGIVGLDVKLTDAENGVLNKLGVNCLRSFVSGMVAWGSRTLDGADDLGSEWKYVPIRRLALFIEESLYRGTQWVVFEPNDEPLWANIRLNVGVFMNRLFRQGAFQGSTPDQAYYVKCDAETTTQADRNLGIVNIEVGFAPLKPAEFVIITIKQIAGQLQ